LFTRLLSVQDCSILKTFAEPAGRWEQDIPPE
jgi:hypothetical protein